MTTAASSVRAPGEPPVRPQRPPRARLTRPRSCLATGVSAGVARHLNWPVFIVRVLFVLLAFLSGAGVLLYVWLWAFMPFEPATGDAGRDTITRRAPIAWLFITLAALLAMFAIYAGRFNYYTQNWPAEDVFPPLVLAVLLAVAASFWATFIDRNDPARAVHSERLVRGAATAVPIVLLTAMFLGPYPIDRAAFGFVAAAILLGGIGLVFAPMLLRLWRELGAERTRRIREEQRSEIAAHLHDSVLQTLALIQNRAGASSEVARIARAQERELRSWLFEADAPADSDLATDLRDWGAALELDYPVRVDIVVVGESGERASGEIAAAAREAMLNAARHAGGEVSVYIEGTTDAVDVYIRDRGPGFDPALIAADRLGVRESIIGRMRRSGGSATVHAGAGGTGAEIHLRAISRPSNGSSNGNGSNGGAAATAAAASASQNEESKRA